MFKAEKKLYISANYIIDRRFTTSHPLEFESIVIQGNTFDSD